MPKLALHGMQFLMRVDV